MLGDRIKQVRIAAGLSLRGLAEATDNYVSAQVIQKYERGITNPGSDVLISLSKAIGVKVEYFFRPDAVQVSLSCPVYRKRASVSKKYLSAIHARVKDQVEKYLEIEMLFPEDRFDKISIGTLRHRNIHKTGDIEKLAEDLRKVWALGNDPIENMRLLAKKYG